MAREQETVNDWIEGGSDDPTLAINPNLANDPPVPPLPPGPPPPPPPPPNGAAAEPAADEDAAEPEPETRDERGRFRGRHRARSQQAGPDDVPRIATLTKQVRALEQQLAQQRTPAAKPQTPPPAAPPPVAPVGSGFTEAEPTLEQFASSDDPYRDYMRALARYDRKKESFDADQTRTKDAREQAGKQHAQQLHVWFQERDKEHASRLNAYIAANPTAKDAMVALANEPITPVLYAAMQLHEQGPAMMHALASHPDVLDELFLLTDGKPVGDPYRNPYVAKTQRRLLAVVQAAPSNGHTGSVAQSQITERAPRPFNPVRTAPHAPSRERPSDDDSLEAHEAHYYPNGPRGRFRR